MVHFFHTFDENRQMEVLNKTVKRGAFTHHLIKRNKHVAMYDTCIDEEVIGYEVFLIKIQKPKIIFGREIAFKEKFPKNEDFGYSAYAPSTRERANEIYTELTIKCQKKIMEKEGVNGCNN